MVTQDQYDKIVNEAIEYSIYVERLEALCKKHNIPQEEIDAIYK